MRNGVVSRWLLETIDYSLESWSSLREYISRNARSTKNSVGTPKPNITSIFYSCFKKRIPVNINTIPQKTINTTKPIFILIWGKNWLAIAGRINPVIASVLQMSAKNFFCSFPSLVRWVCFLKNFFMLLSPVKATLRKVSGCRVVKMHLP